MSFDHRKSAPSAMGSRDGPSPGVVALAHTLEIEAITMADYLNESRNCVAILRALRAGNVAQAEEIARLVTDDRKYVAALQGLALQFLQLIDRFAVAADMPTANADSLLRMMTDQMSLAESIELPDVRPPQS